MSVPEDPKRVNKASDDALHKSKPELQGDPFAVKVSALIKAAFLDGSSKYLLTDLLQDGADHWSSPMNALMPKDMTQADRMEHPDYFLHGGFNEVSGTAAGSAGNAATMHDQGPDAGTDSYENYVQEKDMKDALRQAQIRKKTAALLQKVGLAAPPAIAGDDPSLPNDNLDINTEPDLKRMIAGSSSSKATRYPRTTRPASQVKTGTVKQAIGFSFGPQHGGYNASSSQDSSGLPVQKQTAQAPPKVTDPKGKQPRRAGLQAEFARTQTDPFQGTKIPKGFPADDAKATDAKTAALIKKAFGWR